MDARLEAVRETLRASGITAESPTSLSDEAEQIAREERQS